MGETKLASLQQVMCRFKAGGGAWRACQRRTAALEVHRRAAASAVARTLGLHGSRSYGDEATLPRSGLFEPLVMQDHQRLGYRTSGEAEVFRDRQWGVGVGDLQLHRLQAICSSRLSRLCAKQTGQAL